MRRAGIDLGGGLRFDPPLLLAPMEGVTDRCFRALVLDSNPGAVGATCTEFLRVTAPPLPVWKLAEALGPPHPRVPAGLQLMGNRPDMLAATAARAGTAGAAFVDLNFGCPAPRVYQHCAGSALLDDPPALERLLRAVVDACPLPVTAKIRAGGRDDRRLEEIARRVEQAGARLLTVHARLRVERYQDPADWTRIARAVAAVSIPVVGNGGAADPAAIEALFERTGCAGVMVGRGALGDPWIFRAWADGAAAEASGVAAVLAWLRIYSDRMEVDGATPRQAVGRLKQSLKALDAAGSLPLGGELPRLLRLADPAEILDGLAAAAVPA